MANVAGGWAVEEFGVELVEGERTEQLQTRPRERTQPNSKHTKMQNGGPQQLQGTSSCQCPLSYFNGLQGVIF